MRISDWSSDVCSSDLIPPAEAEERYYAMLDDVPMACPQAIAASSGNTFARSAACADAAVPRITRRSEERRAGKEWVSMCRYRWSQSHNKKNTSKSDVADKRIAER